MGIEPTAPAWEAGVLPLYDARFFGKRQQCGKNAGTVQALAYNAVSGKAQAVIISTICAMACTGQAGLFREIFSTAVFLSLQRFL